MTAAVRKFWLAGTGAIALGFLITWLGFAAGQRQMIETIRLKSVAPILDAKRNLLITLCHPVLAVADQFGDYGFPLFVVLVFLNVLAWAGAAFLVVRTLAGRRSASRSPAV